jgi:hypothetical protein
MGGRSPVWTLASSSIFGHGATYLPLKLIMAAFSELRHTLGELCIPVLNAC